MGTAEAGKETSDDRGPRAPKGGRGRGPRDEGQINLTDSDSALMLESKRGSHSQAYDPQAEVDADGSQLVLAREVLRTPSDANQL